MSKSKEVNVSQAVYNYLIVGNRPYSAVDIYNNLHKEHGKTAVIKALELLAIDQKIVEKVYGKQKIYFPNQKLINFDEQELKILDEKTTSLNAELKEVNQNVKAKETELASLSSSMSIEEIQKTIRVISKEIAELHKRLELINSNEVVIDPEENEKVNTQHQIVTKELRKRKRMAETVIEMILENYPKDKRALYEEVGVEAD